MQDKLYVMFALDKQVVKNKINMDYADNQEKIVVYTAKKYWHNFIRNQS